MFETNADQHVNDLIATLCGEAERCTFDSDAPNRQRLIDQIAQLRASQNPIVQMMPR